MITNTERNVILIYTTIAVVYLIISILTVVGATRGRNTFKITQILNKLKSSQPIMINVMHLGNFLIYSFAYVKALAAFSTTACMIQLFLFHSGFFLIVGSLLLKLYRIYAILNSGFKKVKITDTYMIQLMLLIMIFVWGYLIVITVVGGLDINNYDYCHYKYPQIEYALVAVEGVMFVAILLNTVIVRKAPAVLTDSHRILQSISSCIVLILCLFPLTSITSMREREFAACLGILLASTFVLIETTGATVSQLAILYFESLRVTNQMKKLGSLKNINDQDVENLFESEGSAIGNVHKIRELDFFQSVALIEISKEKEEQQQSKTLSQVIMEETHQTQLVILFDALQRAFKIIARAVRLAGTKQSENKSTGQKSAGGRRIRSLDVIANQALTRALLNSKMCCALVSSESRKPFIVPDSLAGDFVVSFYPINGSTNLECNIAIGSIIAIWDRKSINAVSEDDCLRRGRDLISSAYCIYSFSTELVLTFGDGNRRFRLDPQIGEFTLCETDFVMPVESQFIYSINEGNLGGTDQAIKACIKRFKKAKPNPYSLRYTGSLIADFHRTIAYGGVYLYPADSAKPEGKLRLIYECAPLAFIMENAGGSSILVDSNGIQNILDIEATSIHMRCPLIFGCKRDIDIVYEEYRNIATKLGKVVEKPKSSTESAFRKSNNTVTVTDVNTTTNIRDKSESLA